MVKDGGSHQPVLPLLVGDVLDCSRCSVGSQQVLDPPVFCLAGLSGTNCTWGKD